MDRKKELKEQYKLMKPDMGIFAIYSTASHKYYIGTTQDLKGTINSIKFRLNFGNYSIKELQKEWKEQGEAQFKIEILEKLKYDRDETKTDYTEDLEVLKLIWVEKLAEKGTQFYNGI